MKSEEKAKENTEKGILKSLVSLLDVFDERVEEQNQKIKELKD